MLSSKARDRCQVEVESYLCEPINISVRLFVASSMGTKSKLKRVAIYVAGWGFILLGIAGLVLPILQGILFILVGLFLLSSVSPWAERLLHRIKERFPRISKQFDLAKHKAKSVQSRMAKRFDDAKSNAIKLREQVFKRKPRATED
jgi:hypothetical protein